MHSPIACLNLYCLPKMHVMYLRLNTYHKPHRNSPLLIWIHKVLDMSREISNHGCFLRLIHSILLLRISVISIICSILYVCIIWIQQYDQIDKLLTKYESTMYVHARACLKHYVYVCTCLCNVRMYVWIVHYM